MGSHVTRAVIRFARERKGLSQLSLARLARVHRSTVCRLERGELEPRPRTMTRIVRALEQGSEVIACARAGIVPGTVAHLRDVLPYHVDPVASYCVDHHPSGLSVDQTAVALHLSPRAVDAAQARALRKLAALAAAPGPEGELARRWVSLVRAVAAARDALQTPWDVMTDGCVSW